MWDIDCLNGIDRKSIKHQAWSLALENHLGLVPRYFIPQFRLFTCSVVLSRASLRGRSEPRAHRASGGGAGITSSSTASKRSPMRSPKRSAWPWTQSEPVVNGHGASGAGLDSVLGVTWTAWERFVGQRSKWFDWPEVKIGFKQIVKIVGRRSTWWIWVCYGWLVSSSSSTSTRQIRRMVLMRWRGRNTLYVNYIYIYNICFVCVFCRPSP